MSLFAFRKTSSELLVLRRLRLLARGDLFHAVKDLHCHVKLPDRDQTPDCRVGLAVLMYAHVGYRVAASPDSSFRALALAKTDQIGCKVPELDAESFLLDADWFLETRPEDLNFALPLDPDALKLTLSVYQRPARQCARRLERVGLGTKLLAALASGLVLTIHIPAIKKHSIN
jgi:hypothetical protein